MSTYDTRLPVLGALHEPANRSGVTFNPCSHSAPDSCRRCDGQDAETWESAAHRRERESREQIPPCMQPGWRAQSVPAPSDETDPEEAA